MPEIDPQGFMLAAEGLLGKLEASSLVSKKELESIRQDLVRQIKSEALFGASKLGTAKIGSTRVLVPTSGNLRKINLISERTRTRMSTFRLNYLKPSQIKKLRLDGGLGDAPAGEFIRHSRRLARHAREFLTQIKELEPSIAEEADAALAQIADNDMDLLKLEMKSFTRMKETLLRNVNGKQRRSKLIKDIQAFDIDKSLWNLSLLEHPKASVAQLLADSAHKMGAKVSEKISQIPKRSHVMVGIPPNAMTKMTPASRTSNIAWRMFSVKKLDDTYAALPTKATSSNWRGLGLDYNTPEVYVPVPPELVDDVAKLAAAKRKAMKAAAESKAAAELAKKEAKALALKAEAEAKALAKAKALEAEAKAVAKAKAAAEAEALAAKLAKEKAEAEALAARLAKEKAEAEAAAKAKAAAEAAAKKKAAEEAAKVAAEAEAKAKALAAEKAAKEAAEKAKAAKEAAEALAKKKAAEEAAKVKAAAEAKAAKEAAEALAKKEAAEKLAKEKAAAAKAKAKEAVDKLAAEKLAAEKLAKAQLAEQLAAQKLAAELAAKKAAEKLAKKSAPGTGPSEYALVKKRRAAKKAHKKAIALPPGPEKVAALIEFDKDLAAYNALRAKAGLDPVDNYSLYKKTPGQKILSGAPKPPLGPPPPPPGGPPPAGMSGALAEIEDALQDAENAYGGWKTGTFAQGPANVAKSKQAFEKLNALESAAGLNPTTFASVEAGWDAKLAAKVAKTKAKADKLAAKAALALAKLDKKAAKAAAKVAKAEKAPSTWKLRKEKKKAQDLHKKWVATPTYANGGAWQAREEAQELFMLQLNVLNGFEAKAGYKATTSDTLFKKYTNKSKLKKLAGAPVLDAKAATTAKKLHDAAPKLPESWNKTQKKAETWVKENYPNQKTGLAGMTTAEKDAVRFYKGSGYEDMNHALRYGQELEHYQQTALDNLNSMFAKTRLEKDLMTYRGTGNGSWSEKLKVGSIFEERGVMSTSISKGVADNFGRKVQFRIRVPAGSRAVYADMIPGVPNGGERELLLPPGTKLRIVGEKTEPNTGWGGGNNRILYCEVVDGG